MKHTLHKTVLASILAMISVVSNARDFEVDGIYYNITSSENMTVEVTHYGSAYASARYNGVIAIPASVTYNGKNYAVTSIGWHTFYGCHVTHVINRDGVTSIEPNAFKNCKTLRSVYIPSSVTEIGSHDFSLARDNCVMTAKKGVK